MVLQEPNQLPLARLLVIRDLEESHTASYVITSVDTEAREADVDDLREELQQTSKKATDVTIRLHVFASRASRKG